MTLHVFRDTFHIIDCGCFCAQTAESVAQSVMNLAEAVVMVTMNPADDPCETGPTAAATTSTEVVVHNVGGGTAPNMESSSIAGGADDTRPTSSNQNLAVVAVGSNQTDSMKNSTPRTPSSNPMSVSVPNLPSSMEQTVSLLESFAAVARRNLGNTTNNMARSNNASSLVRLALSSNSPGRWRFLRTADRGCRVTCFVDGRLFCEL